jgi:hypothetical protein
MEKTRHKKKTKTKTYSHNNITLIFDAILHCMLLIFEGGMCSYILRQFLYIMNIC